MNTITLTAIPSNMYMDFVYLRVRFQIYGRKIATCFGIPISQALDGDGGKTFD